MQSCKTSSMFCIFRFFNCLHTALVNHWKIWSVCSLNFRDSNFLFACLNAWLIINSYTLVISIRLTHEKLCVMCIKWIKLSEVENYSLSIRLLHAVETTRLRLCIKFVRVDCTLENECSSHFKLLQKLRFHHHSCCCSEIFRDRDDYSIVQEVDVA